MGEGEKKRKRKRRRREEKRKAKPKRYGTNLGYGFYDLWYGFFMESKDFMALYGILENFMSSKPRV